MTLAAIIALFAAVERLVRALLGDVVRGRIGRGAALGEALDALAELEEVSTLAGGLIEEVALAAAQEAAGAKMGPLAGDALAQEVRPVGVALEDGLLKGAARAREGSRRTFPTVTPETVEEAAHEATTAHTDALGRRSRLAPFASTRTSHAERVAATAGTLAGTPSGARVKVKGRGGSCKVCSPLVGRTYAVSDAPSPPFHPSCDCRLIVVR